MKKSILFFLFTITLIVSSCKNKKKTDYLLFSGKIENPKSDSLSILNNNLKVVKTFRLEKDNTFRDTINIPEGYYWLSDGKEHIQVYLKSNFDLNVSLDIKKIGESIFYKGIGASENNYLAKKALLEKSFGKLNFYGYYAKLSEIGFMKLTDSLDKVQIKLLKETPNLSKDFSFIESKSLEFKKLYKYSTFEEKKRFVTENKEFNVSKNFPDPFANIDLSNEKFLMSPYYLFFIRSYLDKKSAKRGDQSDKNIDQTLEFVKTIQKEVKNKKIKEELAYYVGEWQLNYTNKLDSVYNQIKPLLTNEKYVIEVAKKYKILKKIEKGAISPTFELKDINEKTVTLSEFNGKLVYIDIWATWCLPCLKEVPSLKKMEEDFKDKEIVFVSICKSDTKERWAKMVKEKELTGIQLFSPNDNILFFKDYSVQGIPRFILIDKEGKIIDGNAKPPSDPRLKKEIKNYL